MPGEPRRGFDEFVVEHGVCGQVEVGEAREAEPRRFIFRATCRLCGATFESPIDPDSARSGLLGLARLAGIREPEARRLLETEPGIEQLMLLLQDSPNVHAVQQAQLLRAAQSLGRHEGET
jgi:hypothetical protein